MEQGWFYQNTKNWPKVVKKNYQQWFTNMYSPIPKVNRLLWSWRISIIHVSSRNCEHLIFQSFLGDYLFMHGSPIKLVFYVNFNQASWSIKLCKTSINQCETKKCKLKRFETVSYQKSYGSFQFKVVLLNERRRSEPDMQEKCRHGKLMSKGIHKNRATSNQTLK